MVAPRRRPVERAQATTPALAKKLALKAMIRINANEVRRLAMALLDPETDPADQNEAIEEMRQTIRDIDFFARCVRGDEAPEKAYVL